MDIGKNGMDEMKSRIAALALFALVICGSMCACTKKGTLPPSASSAVAEHALTWQELYDLGVRYLSAGNYQEAILAFTAAIEIDPKQPDAYYLRGDAYAALATDAADTEETLQYYEYAAADYRRAAELGHSDATEKADGIQRAIDGLNQPISGRETLRVQSENESLLRELLNRFEADDPEGAADLLRKSDYVTLCDSIVNAFILDCASQGIGREEYTELVYNPQTDSYSTHLSPPYMNAHIIVQSENGLVMALYWHHYCYYGQWENGMRSGHGIWVGPNNSNPRVPGPETCIFEGTWSDDRPNGEGTIVYRWANGCTWEDKGTFKDGFYNGTFNITLLDSNDNDRVYVFEPFAVQDGIFVDDDYSLDEYGYFDIPVFKDSSPYASTSKLHLYDAYEKNEREGAYHDEYYGRGVDHGRYIDMFTVPGILDYGYVLNPYRQFSP